MNPRPSSAATRAAIDRASRRAERDAAWATYEAANEAARAQYDAMPIAHYHARAAETPVPSSALGKSAGGTGHTS